MTDVELIEAERTARKRVADLGNRVKLTAKGTPAREERMKEWRAARDAYNLLAEECDKRGFSHTVW